MTNKYFIALDFHIETILKDNDLKNTKSNLPKKFQGVDMTFFLNYPLTCKPVAVKITKPTTWKDILLPIAKKYKELEDKGKFKNHLLSDLYVEGIEVNLKGISTIMIGS